MRKEVINREGKTFREQSLEERLAVHPRLRARIESLLCVVENSTGDIERANDAKQRVIEELRQMGNDALHVWAENQKCKKEKEVNEKNKDITKHSKKTLLVHDLWSNRGYRAAFHTRQRWWHSAALL